MSRLSETDLRVLRVSARYLEPLRASVIRTFTRLLFRQAAHYCEAS